MRILKREMPAKVYLYLCANFLLISHSNPHLSKDFLTAMYFKASSEGPKELGVKVKQIRRRRIFKVVEPKVG